MKNNRYFIDSCVFLGILITDKNTRACKSFISRVNNGLYIGYISPFVTGEMINSILYDNTIKNELKPDMIHAIVDLLISVNVNNFVPSKNAMKVYPDLREADERISESDMMHLVCAKILNIPLLTTDGMMLKSQGLKQYVDIISPSDFH